MQNKIADWLQKAANLLNDVVNYDFTDEEGNVLFSTESEDDTLEIGMPATPDGTFELPDGRTVTIADGAISEIVDQSNDLENLQDENEELRNSVIEAQNIIKDIRNQLGSNFQVKQRIKVPAKKSDSKNTKSEEERKAELREKYAKSINRKGEK